MGGCAVSPCQKTQSGKFECHLNLWVLERYSQTSYRVWSPLAITRSPHQESFELAQGLLSRSSVYIEVFAISVGPPASIQTVCVPLELEIDTLFLNKFTCHASALHIGVLCIQAHMPLVHFHIVQPRTRAFLFLRVFWWALSNTELGSGSIWRSWFNNSYIHRIVQRSFNKCSSARSMHAERQGGREAGRQGGREAGRHACRHAGRHGRTHALTYVYVFDSGSLFGAHGWGIFCLCAFLREPFNIPCDVPCDMPSAIPCDVSCDISCDMTYPPMWWVKPSKDEDPVPFVMCNQW